jgi:hypothetical protein
VTINLRGLCNRDNDYSITDSLGNTYSAQVCGTANRQCNPEECVALLEKAAAFSLTGEGQWILCGMA